MAFIGMKQLSVFQLFAASPSPPPRPSAPAQGRSCHELYGAGKFDEILASVDACLPKDAQGNFIPDQERSDVVHDLLAFLADAGDEQREAAGDQGLHRLAGGCSLP